MAYFACSINDRGAMRAYTRCCKDIVRAVPRTCRFTRGINLQTGLAEYEVRYNAAAWTGVEYGPRLRSGRLFKALWFTRVWLKMQVCAGNHAVSYDSWACARCGLTAEQIRDFSGRYFATLKWLLKPSVRIMA